MYQVTMCITWNFLGAKHFISVEIRLPKFWKNNNEKTIYFIAVDYYLK